MTGFYKKRNTGLKWVNKNNAICYLIICYYDFYYKKQPPEVFCKNGVLGNFVKFTGKHLCQSLFFNNIAG